MKKYFYQSMISVFMLTLLCSTIFSCAPVAHEEEVDKKYFKGMHSLEGVLRLAEISCLDPQVCPENIGLVINFNQKQAGFEVQSCTGFLVAPDIVATNSHCVEKSQSYSEFSIFKFKDKKLSNCPDHLGIKFANNKEGEIRREYICKELIYKSETSSNPAESADYAYFKIEATKREPLVLSRNGVDNQEALKLIRVSSNSDKTNGFDLGHYVRKKFESSICHNQFGTGFNPHGVSRWSPTSSLVNCGIYQGNSGSPVFNLNNQVVGILHAGMWPSISQEGNQDKIDMSRTQSKHAVYTSVSCIQDPSLSVSLSQLCDEGRRLNLMDCLTPDQQKIYLKILNEQNQKSYPKHLFEKDNYNPFNFESKIKPEMSAEDQLKRVDELKQKSLCQIMEYK